eukprot:1157918-Pelagomonas_calceolata.AAC.5
MPFPAPQEFCSHEDPRAKQKPLAALLMWWLQAGLTGESAKPLCHTGHSPRTYVLERVKGMLLQQMVLGS